MGWDLDLLINSDAQGRPNRRGGHFHFVRWTDNPNPHTVAQMRAGGRWPGMDCGPAAVLSRLLDDGRGESVRVLESEGGTNPSYGTALDGLGRMYADHGYAFHYVSGSNPPWGLTGMNTAWGGIIRPIDLGAYLAASTGHMIVVDTRGAWQPRPAPPPAPAPAPAPPPPAPAPARHQEDDMVGSVTFAGSRQVFQVNGSGDLWHKWQPVVNGRGWGNELLCRNLIPFSSVVCAAPDPRQLDAYVETSDGHVGHLYYMESAPGWHFEVIP